MPVSAEKSHEVIEWDLPQHDITDVTPTIAEAVKLKPAVIYHLAAITDVDGCEKNRAEAYKVNTLGTWTVALAARDSKAELVYLSTDYIFDGAKKNPYLENDKPNPLNYYGSTKLLGEQTVMRDIKSFYICRTSWLFGPHGRNFVNTILRLAKERPSLDVVDDQEGSPTYTSDLVPALALLPDSKKYGIYNISNAETCTWFKFASEIVRLAGLQDRGQTDDLGQIRPPARRPAYSALDNWYFQSRFDHRLRPWQEALRDF